MIGQKDHLIGQKDSVLTQRALELRFQQDQIKILEQEKALKAAEAEQDRTVRNALLVGAALLLLLAGLLWRLIANKQQANRSWPKKTVNWMQPANAPTSYCSIFCPVNWWMN